MIELQERLAAMAERGRARDRATSAELKERFPEFSAFGADLRANLPGKWQAWRAHFDGKEVGQGTFPEGTWVRLSPKGRHE